MLEQPCFLSFPESTEQGGGWGSEAGAVLFLAKLDLGVGAQGLGISPCPSVRDQMPERPQFRIFQIV